MEFWGDGMKACSIKGGREPAAAGMMGMRRHGHLEKNEGISVKRWVQSWRQEKLCNAMNTGMVISGELAQGSNKGISPQTSFQKPAGSGYICFRFCRADGHRLVVNGCRNDKFK